MRKPALCILLCLGADAADLNRQPIGLPARTYISSTGLAVSNFVLDQSTDKAEYVLQTRDANTVSVVGVRYGLRTGTPPTYRISLQGVDASGNADGTIKSSGNAYVTFTPPADTSWDAAWRSFTLNSSYTPARGEWLSIVVEHSSGAIDAGNNSSFSTHIGGVAYDGADYAIRNDNGTRTRQAQYPLFGWGNGSGFDGWPYTSIYTTAVSSDTTPDEVGLAFKLPSASCDTFKVVGAVHQSDAMAAGKTLVMSLYPTSGGALQSVTWDSDLQLGSTTYTANTIYFDEATLSTLTCGTTYYLAFAPQETASGWALVAFNAPAAADLRAWAGGTDWYWVQRTDGAGWTTNTSRRPWVGLILADITAPSGGGGTRSYATVH